MVLSLRQRTLVLLSVTAAAAALLDGIIVELWTFQRVSVDIGHNRAVFRRPSRRCHGGICNSCFVVVVVPRKTQTALTTEPQNIGINSSKIHVYEFHEILQLLPTFKLSTFCISHQEINSKETKNVEQREGGKPKIVVSVFRTGVTGVPISISIGQRSG